VFLFLLPYIFAIVVIFDVSAGISNRSTTSVAKQAGIGGLVAQSLSASAKHLNGTSRYVALVGSLGALFSAGRSLLKTLRTVHGLVWQVRVPKGSRRTRATIIFIGLITITMALSIGFDHLREVLGPGGVVALVVFDAIPMGFWLMISMAMPHAPKATWRDLLPGALLFGIAVLGLHALTVYWIAVRIRKKSAVYGAIGASLSLLLWAYILGRIMTASAVLNASVWARAHPSPPRPVPVGEPS
jgi:uncharacterized BrkB/YihY/UPF0761 family membrane protein